MICDHCQSTGVRPMTRSERYRRGRLPFPPQRCPYCIGRTDDDEPEGPKAA